MARIPRVRDVFNPIVYGAKGDGQWVENATLTSGSNLITSPVALFEAADVGKEIWAVYAGALALPICTITSIVSTTQIRVSANATQTTSLAELHWGTDDTAALIRCFQAARDAKPVSQTSNALLYRGTNLRVRPGIYHFKKVILDNNYANIRGGVGIIGSGAGKTVFVARPDYDWTTTSVNKGMFTRFTQSFEVDLFGFTVHGGGYNFTSPYAANYALEVTNYSGRKQPKAEDITVMNFKGIQGGMAVVGTGGGEVSNCCLYNNDGANLILIGPYISVYNTLVSNGQGYGIKILNVDGETGTGVGVNLIGCILDEHVLATVYLENSTDVNMIACRAMAGANAPAVELVNSKIRVTNCQLIPFHNNANTIGIKLDANSVGYITNSRVKGSQYSYQNAGQLNGNGCNVFTGATNGNALVGS